MKNILKHTLYLLVIAVMFMGCEKAEHEISAITMTSQSENVEISTDGQSASVLLNPMGSSEEIVIAASSEWAIVKESDNDWCKVTRDGDKIIISADEFASSYDHHTISRVTLLDGRGSVTINVRQKGTDMADIILNPAKLEFPEMGGSQTVEVTANRGWAITGHEGISWISIVVEDDSFIVTTTANHNAADLKLKLSVKAGVGTNTDTAECAVVVGKQTPAYITTNGDMVAASENGGVVRVPVDCNRDWSVGTSDQWYSLARENDELVITVTPKPGMPTETGSFKLFTFGDDPVEKVMTIKRFDNPMIVEYTSTASDAVAVFPIAGTVNVYIEWGDGTTESVSGSLSKYGDLPEHTYKSAGVYSAKVYGEATIMYYSVAHLSGDIAHFTALKQWGNLGFTDLTSAFQGTVITKIPDGYKEVMQKATNIASMFTNSQLSEIPADFFEGCSQITSANGVFAYSKLASIPAGFMDGLTGITSAVAMFSDTPITSIPSNMFKNQSELMMLNTTFKNCTSLKTIPADMLSGAVKLTTVLGTFSGCSALEAIPVGLFDNNPEITNANMTFMNCVKLPSIPVTLFDNCKKIFNFSSTFAGCVALTGSSPYTDISGAHYYLYDRSTTQGFVEPTMFVGCFKGCINLTDYATIPATWK